MQSNQIKSNHAWQCHLLFGCAFWHAPNANDAIRLPAAHYGPCGASHVLQPSRRRKLEGANGSLVHSCGYKTSLTRMQSKYMPFSGSRPGFVGHTCESKELQGKIWKLLRAVERATPTWGGICWSMHTNDSNQSFLTRIALLLLLLLLMHPLAVQEAHQKAHNMHRAPGICLIGVRRKQGHLNSSWTCSVHIHSPPPQPETLAHNRNFPLDCRCQDAACNRREYVNNERETTSEARLDSDKRREATSQA
jgi:hypothetical protein